MSDGEIVFSINNYSLWEILPWQLYLLFYGFAAVLYFFPSASRLLLPPTDSAFSPERLPIIGKYMVINARNFTIFVSLILVPLFFTEAFNLSNDKDVLDKGFVETFQGCYIPPGDEAKSYFGSMQSSVTVNIAGHRLRTGSGFGSIYLIEDLRPAVVNAGPLKISVKEGAILQAERISVSNPAELVGCGDRS